LIWIILDKCLKEKIVEIGRIGDKILLIKIVLGKETIDVVHTLLK